MKHFFIYCFFWSYFMISWIILSFGYRRSSYLIPVSTSYQNELKSSQFDSEFQLNNKMTEFSSFNDLNSIKSNDDLVFDTFIEFTDHYGMIYYPNYVIFMERQLSRYFNQSRRVISIKSMKYRKAARLGDRIYVRQSISKKFKERFDFEIYKMGTNDDSVSEETLFTATGVDSHSIYDENGQILRKDISFQSLNASHIEYASSVYDFDVYQDEIGVHGLTTKTILNLFERGRSNALGGPAMLSNSSLFDNIHVYVNKINDYHVWNDAGAMSLDSSVFQRYGSTLCRVVTDINIIGDLVIEFNQRLFLLSSQDFNQVKSAVLASAVISTVCVRDNLPVSIPLHIKQKLTKLTS